MQGWHAQYGFHNTEETGLNAVRCYGEGGIPMIVNIVQDPALFEKECRATLETGARRIEEIRRLVERTSDPQRRQMETELDHLRGLLNRARARLEGLRLVSQDSVAFEQAVVRGAVNALTIAVADIARHFSQAA